MSKAKKDRYVKTFDYFLIKFNYGTIKALQRLINLTSIPELVNEFGSAKKTANAFEPFLAHKYSDGTLRKEKSKLKRFLENLQKENFIYRNTHTNRTGKTDQDLYFEIKSKFLKVA